MPRNAEVYRETVVDTRTSGTSGTATVPTTDGNALTTIQGMGLENFDELIIYAVSTQNIAGALSTFDLYFQRALVPNPDPTTAGHWADFYHMLQIADGGGMGANGLEVTLPVNPPVGVTGAAELANQDYSTLREGQTARSVRYGHWGDRIRIREKMGGTVTTPLIYSIHITGRIN